MFLFDRFRIDFWLILLVVPVLVLVLVLAVVAVGASLKKYDVTRRSDGKLETKAF